MAAALHCSPLAHIVDRRSQARKTLPGCYKQKERNEKIHL